MTTITTTLTAADDVPDVPGIRYATNGPKIGHLLPTTWPPTTRRGRPSVCGQWRVHWRLVERCDDPTSYRPCPDCTRDAGIDPDPPTTPVRIAPPTRHADPTAAPPPRAAVVVNTQAARVARRTAFAASFAPHQ